LRDKVRPASSQEDGTDAAVVCGRHHGAAPVLRSVVVKPVGYRSSYKEAVLGANIHRHKPRIDEEGFQEVKEKYWWRKGRRPVHSRLGPKVNAPGGRIPVRERLGERPFPEARTGGFLQLLKTKAAGKCFRCLAADHTIAVCRDPPRCILCSRSGHKARFCRSAAAGRWRAAPSASKEQEVHPAREMSGQPAGVW